MVNVWPKHGGENKKNKGYTYFYNCICWYYIHERKEQLRLFTDHTYMFRSHSAIILRGYSIEKYNKKLYVANQSKIWI
jgi:hypothetical protein